MAIGVHHADHVAPSICKSRHFADKQWSLGRYSLLADSGHGVTSEDETFTELSTSLDVASGKNVGLFRGSYDSSLFFF
jgi:hypothetical protein